MSWVMVGRSETAVNGSNANISVILEHQALARRHFDKVNEGKIYFNQRITCCDDLIRYLMSDDLVNKLFTFDLFLSRC